MHYTRNKSTFERKVLQPLTELLKQGITPHKLALTIALGVSLGNFPIFGVTTLLCTVAAFLLRLNLAAIHLVNYVMYPLQLSLVIPFVRLGAWLLNDMQSTVTLDELKAILDQDWNVALMLLWKILLQASLGWCVIAPLMTISVYLIVL
ncbi:MAG: DUF2062 domain-containing protein, partial [Flammeovirgaceae bacterium]|nr:DUF2062 domain-containing protein [Flammeovirgaceae bacterium]MDW8288108.1 DUF2062 domain-containing protein [Flammeovirgaceae bacterium]